jgi:hypothetical protein
VTEVAYLLDFDLRAQVDALRWIHQGAVTLADITADDFERAIEIIEKYADLPADFADASLLAIAERLGIREIATVDRDFSVYRLKGKKAIRNILPAGATRSSRRSRLGGPLPVAGAAEGGL